MPAAFFMQVLRVEGQEHITAIDVVIQRAFTDACVKGQSAVFDRGQRRAGAEMFIYDLGLHVSSKGVVIADFQIRPLGPQVFLILALCNLRAVALLKGVFIRLLDAHTALDFIVNGLFAFAQCLCNFGNRRADAQHTINDEPIFPLNVRKTFAIHTQPPEIKISRSAFTLLLCSQSMILLYIQLKQRRCFTVRQNIYQLAVECKAYFEQRGQLRAA